ncbi:MAG: NFACT family protein [Lachnospiraceae bacterium]|nr:NFACT family protein [Lachnospiraceae bacterium]
MVFDGITVAAVVKELNDRLSAGRITKIAQPEKEEILITVKSQVATERLFINASASMPSIYLTDENKPSPMTAPNFCMVLRKHLQGGKVLGVTQPGLERVVRIRVEHLDEMGDVCERVLIFELMGKHSNLILTDANGVILDAIKHVSAFVSSVREVLPGRNYFIPNTEEKSDMLSLYKEENAFYKSFENAMKKPFPIYKRIYTSYTGISPQTAMELCNKANVDGERDFRSEDEKKALFEELRKLTEKVANGNLEPVSEALVTYYSEKNKADVMRSKSADLKHHLQTILERDYKKLDLQKKQFQDAEDREKYRICGELLNAYGHQIEDGSDKAEVFDYYENKNRIIKLDPEKTVSENAVRYYEKYNKCKRTAVALSEQIRENEEEIEYLEGILTYISLAGSEDDLAQIRAELWERGFVKRLGNTYAVKQGGKGKKGVSKLPKAKPLHIRTEDGYEIYIGRNNLQNEAVTFDIATGNDWWFHAKGVPGAHVVVKCPSANQAKEWDMPDEIFELAGALALANSKNKDMEKGEVDYLRKKNVKRPNNAAYGFVVYYTNYSLVAENNLEKYTYTIV